MVITVLAIFASMVLIILALVRKAQKETRKKHKIIADKIASIASGNGFNWSHTETSLHRASAWFAEKRLLLFIDFVDEKERVRMVKMEEIAQCTVAEIGTVEVSENKSTYKHITQVALVLHYKDKAKGVEELQFYNELYDGPIERIRLTEKANNWKALMMQS